MSTGQEPLVGRPGTTTIKVDYLARVEGEGALLVKVKAGKLQDVKLQIFEPPRLFEAFLRGRHYQEVPDITARICGICPIAYQMSSVHAMERALGVRVDGALRELRRLFYCGEYIESHALHIYMLHAPDFFGVHDVVEMAAQHGDVVRKALRLKKIGNQLVSVIGGREIHPISACVGGFYCAPRKEQLLALRDDLQWALEASIETAKLVAGFPFPDFEQDYEYVALRHPEEYPFNEGRIASNKGLDIDVSEFEDHFLEQHVKHSTSLHSVLRERGSYLVGPHARYHLNFDRLPEIAKQTARQCGIEPPCNNPFKSIIIRAVEMVFACHEALRIIDSYEQPQPARIDLPKKAGTGQAATEAPRGLLYHRYSIDEEGRVLSARIVPPTAQNQKRVEDDLWSLVPRLLHLPTEEIQQRCEMAIRNYDPCISCSCHFLKMRIERED